MTTPPKQQQQLTNPKSTQQAFSFGFRNLPLLSQCCDRAAVCLGLWACSKSHFWAHVLC